MYMDIMKQLKVSKSFAASYKNAVIFLKQITIETPGASGV